MSGKAPTSDTVAEIEDQGGGHKLIRAALRSQKQGEATFEVNGELYTVRPARNSQGRARPQKRPSPLEHDLRDESYAARVGAWMEGKGSMPWTMGEMQKAFRRAETQNDKAIVLARVFSELYAGEWRSSVIGLIKNWASDFQRIYDSVSDGYEALGRVLVQMAMPDKPARWNRADFCTAKNQHRIDELATRGRSSPRFRTAPSQNRRERGGPHPPPRAASSRLDSSSFVGLRCSSDFSKVFSIYRMTSSANSSIRC